MVKIRIYENSIVGKSQSNRKQVKYLRQGLVKLPVMCVNCDGSSGVFHPPTISVHNKYNKPPYMARTLGVPRYLPYTTSSLSACCEQS
jgi:hypothetical protein